MLEVIYELAHVMRQAEAEQRNGMKVAFYTLGCKVNQYDTQTMMALFRDAGFEIVPFEERADVYVINTCTVTAMSDKKSRQIVSRAYMRNPESVLAVAGCYAQRDAREVLALPGVRLALGNANRSRVVELVERILHEGISIDAVNEIHGVCDFEELPALCEGKTRAHIKIQDGCNRFCSYCIIPYARGPVRSRLVDSIVREARRLGRQGFAEFVLTGIHLSSYGTDCGVHLLDAIMAVSSMPEVSRVRLGSLEPMILTRDFVRACAENPKLCRQFHVSMQSGSAGVLRRMNRRYSPEQFAEHVEMIRQYMPEAAITTDVIAGFPAETEEEHQETLRFVERMAFARMHVFPFSPRVGTKAALMSGQVPKRNKEHRARELIELGRGLEHAYLDAQLGEEVSVLFEEAENNSAVGYSGTYMRVAVPQSAPKIESGQMRRVRLLRREGEMVWGEVYCD